VDGDTTGVNAAVSSATTITLGSTVNSLLLSSGGSINGSGTLSVSSGGVLATANVSIGNITPGTLAFGSAEGVVNVTTGKTLTIGSAISGTDGLTKIGAGVLNLSGGNGYSGNTTLSQGQININNPTALGSSTLVINAGTIDNTSGAPVTLSNVNPESWNANFTFAGSSGSNSNLNLGTGAITLANNPTVTVTSAASNLTIGGPILGSGQGLTFAGLGTKTLTGSGSLLGELNVSAGTLLYNNPAATTLLSGTGGIGNPAINLSAAISSGTAPTFVMSAGSLALANQWYLAHDGSYGIAVVSGGTINQTASYLRFGYNGGAGSLTFTGSALFNQGSTSNILLDMGAAYGCNTQLAVSGNANVTLGQIIVGDYNTVNGSSSENIATVSGSGLLTGTSLVIAGESSTGGNSTTQLWGQFLQTGGTTNIKGPITLATNASSGIVSGSINLQGGVLQTSGTIAGGAGSSFFNFHGGTLAYSGSTAATDFLDLGATGNAYVYEGGAINTGSQSVTLTKPLLTPNSNKGVSSITVTSSSSNLAVAPGVVISGGGGSGATAVATISGGVITGVTITNPGSGYTSTPTVAFYEANSSAIGAGTVVLNSGNNYTGGITVLGGGTLNMNAVNTYTGPTTVQQGTLKLGVQNAISAGGFALQLAGILNLAGSAQTIASGGIVSLQGGAIINAPASGSAIVLNSGNYDAQSGSYAVNLGGSAGLAQNTAGSFTLSGNQNYTGPTLVNSGAVTFSGGSLAGSGGTVASGATLNINGGTLAVGTLTLNNGATLSTASSGAVINALTLGSLSTDTVTLNEAIGTGASIFNVTSAGGLAITGSATINVTVGGTVTSGSNYALISYNGTYSGNYLNLTPVFTGRTSGTIYNDTANHSIDAHIGTSAYPVWNGNVSNVWDGVTNNWLLSNGDGATNFQSPTDNVLFNDSASGSGAVTVSISGSQTPVAIATGVQVNNNSRPYTFTGAGSINGGTGLLKTGSASLTISNNNTYTGGTDLVAGTLRIDNGTSGSAIGTGALTMSGGTLSAGPTSGVGSVAGLVLPGVGPSVIGPSLGLSSGYGTLNLNGGLTTSNSTTLNFQLGTTNIGGIYVGDLLNISGSSSLLTIGANTSLTLKSNPAAAGDYRLIGLSSGASISGGSASLSNIMLPSVSGYSFSLSTGVDSGYIDLVTTLAGPYTWSGSNSATWDTSTANFTSAPALSLPTNFVNGTAVKFDDTASTLYGSVISLSGTLSPGGVTVSSNTTNYTFAGPGILSGTGSLTKQGSSTLTISASGNNYTGGTYVNAGVLQLGVSNALPTTGTMTVNSGTLDLNGKAQTIASLSGASGTVTTSGSAATLMLGGATATYAGTLSTGAGLTLTMSGNGIQTLTGAGSTLKELVDSTGTLAVAAPATINIATSGDAIDVTGVNGAIPTFSMTGGSLSINNRWRIGHDGNAGIATISGGTINQSGGYLDFGFNGGQGLLVMSNSAVYSGPGIQLIMGQAYNSSTRFVIQNSAAASFGVVDIGDGNGVPNANNFSAVMITGGTLNGTSMLVGNNCTNSTAGLYAQYNQSGGVTNISGNITLVNNATSGTEWGSINLSGGTLSTSGKVTAGTGAAGHAFFNFHGGTLSYTGATAQSDLIDLGYAGSIDVYEGGTINTGSRTVTLTQPLLTPNGSSGVSSIPVTSGGSGYLVPPSVLITGGGGTGATAIANISAAGVITGVTITNPGTGYTSAPTVSLQRGSGSGAALGTIAVTANSYSGGITKQGSGTLIMSAVSTYTGGTTVAAGTLVLLPAAGLSDGPIVVQSGATFTPLPNEFNPITAGTSYASLSINAGGIFDMSGDTSAGIFTVNGQSGAQSLSINGGTLGFGYGGYSVPATELVVTGGSGSVLGTNVINVAPLYNVSTGTYGLILDAAGLGGAGTFTLSSTSVTIGSSTYLLSLQRSSTAESLVVALPGASTYNWAGQTSGDGKWTTAANWNNAVPGAGSVAVFSDPSATRNTVDLGSSGNITVAGLTFNGNLNNINITATDPSNPSLVLDGTLTGGVATVTVAGSHTISANVQLSTSADVIAVSGTDQLTVSGNVGGAGSLTLDGAGTLILSGTNNTFSGGTTVDSGTLILNGAGALAAGSSLTIGSDSNLGGVIVPQVSHPTALTLAPVPEPGTLALFAVGAVALGLGVWRRKSHGRK
jgi:autotransporter-associated beta strand protein